MLSDEQLRLAKRLKNAARACKNAGLGLVAMDTSLSVAKLDRLRACPFEADEVLRALTRAIKEDGLDLGGDLVEWSGGW